MGNVPVHRLVVHLADTTKLHGAACNHEVRRRPLQTTTDLERVTCRACLGPVLLAARTGDHSDGPGNAS